MLIIVTAVGMATLMRALGKSMTFYTHTLNVVWLYLLPGIAAVILFHLAIKKRVLLVSPHSRS